MQDFNDSQSPTFQRCAASINEFSRRALGLLGQKPLQTLGIQRTDISGQAEDDRMVIMISVYMLCKHVLPLIT